MALNQLTLSTRNVKGVIANVYKARDGVLDAVKTVVANNADRVHQRAYDLCPKDTYFMADHIRTEFTPNELGFEVGWDEEDFISAGFAFYPLFQEFGTVKMEAQPSLFPAYQEVLPDYRTQLAEAIRGSIDRARPTP